MYLLLLLLLPSAAVAGVLAKLLWKLCCRNMQQPATQHQQQRQVLPQ
jgi:hypothetical protein